MLVKTIRFVRKEPLHSVRPAVVRLGSGIREKDLVGCEGQ
jgi:hypothetical protein